MNAKQPNADFDAALPAWPASLLLVVATLLAYAGVGGHDFVAYDDPDYVTENEVVREGLTADGLRWAFTAAHSANWHPLTWIAHMLDVELFGVEQAGGHHRTSLALHALNAVLLFLFLRRATGAHWRSLLVALLFALHPLRVQSVAWVSERKDLLSSTFGLLALLAWVRHAGAPGVRSMLATLALYGMSLLAKPMLVSLPLVLLLLDGWPLRRWGRERATRLVLEKLPFVALAVLSGVATVIAQEHGRALTSVEAMGLAERAGNAIASYGTYLAQVLWPHGLAYFHPHPIHADPSWSPFGPATWAWAALLVAITIALARLARRAPWGLVGWLWFGVTLGPVIGLVQVGDQGWAERYVYLPAIGLHVILAWALGALVAVRPAWRQAVVAGAALLVAGFGWRTQLEQRAWRDSRTLYETALARTERNYRAREGLGNLALNAGDFERAQREYDAALAVRPGDPGTLFNYGVLEERRGNPAAAETLLERSIESDPGWALPYLNLAKVRMSLGRPAEAEAALLALLTLEPRNANAHYNLGLIRGFQDAMGPAIEALTEALAIDPEHPEAPRVLGTFLRFEGRWAEAKAQLERACSGPRPHPQAATQLAWILAAAPEAGLRDPERAVGWAEYGVQGTGGEDGDALEALAAAYARAGRFEEALEAQRRAVGLTSPERRARAMERLRAYREGRTLDLAPE